MPGRVTVTIDGVEMAADAGDLVIKVAQDHGIYIPRFCWHERMKPVGMCRMCLVEIEGQRGLPPACTATVTDGMVVRTQTPGVKKAQEGVLEFLLINHPLDCPVCDRGGECPLQDLTFGYGPGESRFVEEKRHFAKPIAISELVLLDRERCILCARCTRFADEVAGDPLISFVERGAEMQVLTFPDEPFTSYFSGNTVQICPVGALLASPYRFRARPWDLSSVETSCQLCSLGCRIALQSSADRLVRVLGVDSEPLNHGWLCDKGRFAFDYVHHPDRIADPQVRDVSPERQVNLPSRVEATWPEALDAAAAGLAGGLDRGGPSSVAVIGGARGTNEDAYAWARFAKSVLRTDNVDCQLGDGLPAEVVNGLPRARLSDCDTARAIVLLAPDLKEELAVTFLRVKRAAVDLKVPLIEISPVTTGLSRYATKTVADVDAAIALLKQADENDDRPVVVILGRPSLAEPADATVAAAAALRREIPGVRFLSALRRGNVHGGLDLGLVPGFLPGRVTLDVGRRWFEAAWGAVPSDRGLDTGGILGAAAEGRLQALVLLGADPLSDFPDRDLARRALANVPFILAVDAFPTPSTDVADVFLPVALAGEKRGTTTNLEGRLLRLARKVTPPGTAMEDWRIAVELAVRLGVDFDLEAVDEVTDEIARLAPAHLFANAALLRSAVDGAVIPLGDSEEPVFGGPAHPISPAADSDPGMVGGPIESLVVMRGSASAFGTAVPGMGGTGSLAPGSTSGAHPGEGLDVPACHEWGGQVTGPPGPTDGPAGNGGLRLWSGRKLYSPGVAVTHSASVAKLAAENVVRLHPDELDRLGAAPGAPLTVTSPGGSITLPAQADKGIPAGMVWIPAGAAADLVAGGATTRVSVEVGVGG